MADLDRAVGLQRPVEAQAEPRRGVEVAERGERRARRGRVRQRHLSLVGRAGEVGPGVRHRREALVGHDDQVELAGAPEVGRLVRGGHAGQAGQRPRPEQALLGVGLHRQRVGAPDHPGAQAAGMLVGGDAGVELAGGRAEHADLDAGVGLSEPVHHRGHGVLGDRGVQGELLRRVVRGGRRGGGRGGGAAGGQARPAGSAARPRRAGETS